MRQNCEESATWRLSSVRPRVRLFVPPPLSLSLSLSATARSVHSNIRLCVRRTFTQQCLRPTSTIACYRADKKTTVCTDRKQSMTLVITWVCDVADRAARRRGSAHAKFRMLIKPFLLLGLAAEYRSWWWSPWLWSTAVRRPSDVYGTHRRTIKLTAPETISRSRDMVGAHQNVNGLRDLTTSLSGIACHPWASTCYHEPVPTKLLTNTWKAIQNVEKKWFAVLKVTGNSTNR